MKNTLYRSYFCICDFLLSYLATMCQLELDLAMLVKMCELGHHRVYCIQNIFSTLITMGSGVLNHASCNYVLSGNIGAEEQTLRA